MMYERMIVYKSCSYVIMALLCTACAAGSPEEDMEDRVRIDPVAGGYYPSISPSAQTRGATPDGETLKIDRFSAGRREYDTPGGI